jgi:hypothetical protein
MRAIVCRLRQRRGGQRGDTLVEILLTVFIMGTVLITLMGLVMTIMTASAVHRGKVAAGNQASTIAEAIDRLPYVACGSAANYDTAVAGLESGFEATIVSVRYLSDGSTATPTFLPAGSACPGGVDEGAQMVSVRVRMSRPPHVSTTVDLVKRDTTCPAGVTVANGMLREGEQC